MHLKKVLKKIPGVLFLKNFLNIKNVFLFPLFLLDYFRFTRSSLKQEKRFSIKFSDIYICMTEKTTKTNFDSHYLYHTAWAARVLSRTRPDFHVDISSSLSFTTLVSAFVPIKSYDYRPAEIKLSNFSSKKADLVRLPFQDKSINSLSCMHTIEHVGLGRYGDKIDPRGDIKSISELKRVLSSCGDLIIVVPIGRPRIKYNAHRIFSYKQINEYFSDLTLIEFSLVTDNGEFIQNALEEIANNQSYGCGCFWFRKD